MGFTTKAQQKLQRAKRYLQRDVWSVSLHESETWLKQILRVILISIEGVKENLLLSRAAALSYSSLIGLGPVLAILVILSGSLIKIDPEAQIKEGLLFIAPSLSEYLHVQTVGENPSDLDQLISTIVSGSQTMLDKVDTGGSTIFGSLGILVLIWVGIQLLTTIEMTLNQIWGIKKGRPWSQRVVFYWTFLSLGGVLGLGSTALFSAGNIAGMMDWLPQGKIFAQLLIQFSPYISFFMLVSLLTLFYMFFPNTTVKFKAAFSGSVITALLLIANNFISLIYVQKVLTVGSLYGSLGIIPVLMFGMYFFWVFILFGGVLTYAIQNCQILTNQTAWKQISPITQQALSLSVFLTIARQYQDNNPPMELETISERLKVPSDALNASIEKLIELDWIHQASTEDKKNNESVTTFLPSIPLNQIHLGDFRQRYDRLGNSKALDHLVKCDPLLPMFIENFSQSSNTDLTDLDIECLFKKYPLSSSNTKSNISS